jgi:hypothetical protein
MRNTDADKFNPPSSVTHKGTQRGGKRRRQKGGNQGAYPDSAWGFQLNNLGNGWRQFMDTLSVQPGDNLGASQSNAIVPVRNVNAQTAQPALSPNMSGGRRRRNRSRKGGNLAAVVEQAAVPLVLLGMQQSYKKKHSRRHHSSRKNRSRKTRR